MRTTIALDRDLAVQIERIRRSQGVSMRRAINDLLRQALAAPPPARRRPYRMKLKWKAKSLVGSLDNVAQVLQAAEGDRYR